MKTYGLSIVLLLINFSTFGQKTTSDSPHKNLSIAIKIHPSITKNSSWYGFSEFITSFQSRFSLLGGIEVSKRINKDWFIEGGLLICDWGFKEVGMTEPSRELQYYTQQFFYATLPVTMEYQIGVFRFGAGLNASYFINRNETKNGDFTSYSTPIGWSSFPRLDYWLFGYNFKAGIELPINEKLSFQSELYSIFGFIGNELRFFHNASGLHSYGLELGLDFKIK